MPGTLKMRLRSMVPKIRENNSVKVQKLEEKPYIGYDGELHYYTTFIDCAMICDELVKMAQNKADVLVLGFDMEWPFNFQTGPGKTAVIQISPSLTKCYVFHVNRLKNLPTALIELLSHSNVRLAGVNIKNDIHKLGRDFPKMDIKPMLDNCVDCRMQAKGILPVEQRASMEKLVDHVFNMRINKDKKIRASKWDVVPLTEAQQRYAAIDAYVSLRLYLYFTNLQIDQEMHYHDEGAS